MLPGEADREKGTEKAPVSLSDRPKCLALLTQAPGRRESLCRGRRGPAFSSEDTVSCGDGTLLVRRLEQRVAGIEETREKAVGRV